MSDIIEQLKRYDHLYHDLGQPEVSDKEYDLLKSKARELYPDDPYFGVVGTGPSTKKVKLPFVMGSLTKAKNDGTLDEWLRRHPNDTFIVTPKLDGVSILVNYKNGKVHKAYTRGDGTYGNDITDKARIFLNPIECDEDVWLRGECLLIGDIHKSLGFKTRRNGVAGILNRKDVENAEHVHTIFYEVLSYHPTCLDRYLYLGSIIDEKNMVPYTVESYKDEDKFTDILRTLKAENVYDIDGLVLEINNSEREDALYPENKVAYKVNEESIDCKITDIVWNTTRTGRVVPVVHIEPTEISGVTVSKATGFNADFVRNNGLNIGAVVGIYRSGDVIPYIDNVTEASETPLLPDVCTSCGTALIISGVDLFCSNMDCPAQKYYRVEYFLRTLGAENITEKTLRKLQCDSIEKAYELNVFEIGMIEGFGIKRGEQVVSEINKTLKPTPHALLAAFGLPGIGKEVSKIILKSYDFEEIWTLSVSQLTSLQGIGSVLARNFTEKINDFEPLYGYLVDKGMKWLTASNTLRGNTFTLTGSGPVKRDALVGMIEANGGFVKGISKKVDYLVVADINTTSSKAKKARSYGIPLITYEELLERLG